jgi:hypothetical protein
LTRDNEDEADNWDPFDGTGPSYGRLFLERLLLSLIDAHPNPRVKSVPERILREREGRLRLAMKALCGKKPSQKLPDDAALRWMAGQYAGDRARKARGVQLSQATGSLRSERQLAQEASEKFYPKITDKSERLRKKWEEQKERWLAVVRYHDDLIESIETQVLANIWIALAEEHVPVVPNLPTGHAMSEEQMLGTGLPELERLVELLRAKAKRASG